MDISLPFRLEQFIKDKVKSGLYRDESDVIREALRCMERQERSAQLELEQLREMIHVGDEQVERGEFSSRTIDNILAENNAAL